MCLLLVDKVPDTYTALKKTMKKIIIATHDAPPAIGPYSQGMIVGSTAYSSGQIPVDPATGLIPEGIEAQAHQSCKNVAAVLAAGGSDISKVVKTTCFLSSVTCPCKPSKC